MTTRTNCCICGARAFAFDLGFDGGIPVPLCVRHRSEAIERAAEPSPPIIVSSNPSGVELLMRHHAMIALGLTG